MKYLLLGPGSLGDFPWINGGNEHQGPPVTFQIAQKITLEFTALHIFTRAHLLVIRKLLRTLTIVGVNLGLTLYEYGFSGLK